MFPAYGTKRHRVAMFVGCVMPQMYAATEDAVLGNLSPRERNTLRALLMKALEE